MVCIRFARGWFFYVGPAKGPRGYFGEGWWSKLEYIDGTDAGCAVLRKGSILDASEGDDV